MSDQWHYWLFEGEQGQPPLPVEGTLDVFISLEQARDAAAKVGRAVDIYRTPESGGMAEYVETIGSNAPEAPDSVEGKIETVLPSIVMSARGEIKASGEVERKRTVSKQLESRWNVEAPPGIHVRQLHFHPPSAEGEPWRVEALDESGNVLGSGMGHAEDAYLELWDEIKPPDS